MGECVELLTGFPFKSASYSSDASNVRLLRGDNVAQGVLRWDDAKRWPNDQLTNLSEYALQADDIVLAMDRPWIAAGLKFAHIRQADLPCYLVQRVARLRAREVVDARFLRYVIGSQAFTEYILSIETGTAVPHISSKQIAGFEFDLPPKGEQERIGLLLGMLDDRIDMLHQTNATLESIAQALFKSWFIDFDPVRAKAEGRELEGMDAETASLLPDSFENSALGEIPKGWRASTLEGLTAVGRGLIQTGPFGSQLHASDYSDEGVPVVMPQDLEGRRVSTARIARVSDKHIERLSRHKLRTGDIVFSRRGDVGRHASITPAEAGWLCGTGCLLVRPGEKWPSPTYVSFALATETASDWLHRHAVGATMPNLNTAILGALPILLPPEPTLLAFEKIAGPLEKRISENLTLLRTLMSIRDALLPRLVSGKLRLPESEAQLNEALA
ncbi:restriction endonuclease subunit S [Burkholderia thailandensis]|uniref:restriction endonuclease subunit S n=1 Tax=Burkholderia thailandensis TaxID=57975 RepID=UPI00195E61FF|nr:restriction endonuclease subunit S [Burkholderia thailandensis]